MTYSKNYDELLLDLRNKIDAAIEAKRVVATELMKQYLPEYEQCSLYRGSICFSFKYGEWKGTPQYQTLEVCFGYNENYNFNLRKSIEFFNFEVNVSAMGAFQIITDSPDAIRDKAAQYRCMTYYKGMGVLLTNDDFKNAIYNLVRALCDEIKPLQHECYELSTEKRKEEAIYNAAVEKAEADKKFIEDLAWIKANPDGFAQIVEVYNTTNVHFTYRKKNVKIVKLGDRYSVYGCDKKVVEVSKLKVVA